MNQKEINELRRRFRPEKSAISRVYGCYVNSSKEIVSDLDAAMERIELYAAPINNKRLDRPNPCTITGMCMDCQGATRICNMTSILHKKPPAIDFHVVVVGEDLGF